MLYFMDYFNLSHIVYELILFLALLWGQNITWVFSNLMVFTLYKSMIGCPNWQPLLITEIYRPEWIKRGSIC